MERPTTSESGLALLASVLMAMAAGGIVLVMSITSRSSHQLAEHRTHSVQARYLAEGAVELAKQAIQDAAALVVNPPTTGNGTIDGVAVSYTITAVGAPSLLTDASGIQTTVQSYEVAGSANVAGADGNANRIVNAEWTPLFQYAVFFEQSLDILPTPDMVLTGRVQTNGDLRLGCNTATLTLDTNFIRAAGDLRRWKKHSNTPTVGNVLLRKWVANPFDPSEPEVYEDLESLSQMTSLGIPSVTGYDSLFDGLDNNGDGVYDVSAGDWLPFDAGLLDRYGPPPAYGQSGNTLLLGAQGATRVAPPTIGSLAMYEPTAAGDYEWDVSWEEYVPVAPGTGTHQKGFFHRSAGLSIIVADDGSTFSAYDVGGVDVTGAVSGAVTIDQSYDARQGGYVPVAMVDVAALNASTAFPVNGLLYVSHYGMGTGTDSKGVHLVNGAEISADLTVATEGSAYIQGDYNTVNMVSTSVLADAINLLSNSWVNTPAEPVASNTTYNVAMVIGNAETVTGQYNGGLENFPRFHEDWTGVTCTVLGSMISAWENQYATGSVSDAQFSPPIRNYGYDQRFNDVTKLPKFTPMSARVVDIVRW